MKKTIMFLEGRRIYLRPLSLSDVSQITAYANDPEVRKFLANIYPQSELAEESWLRKKMEGSRYDILFSVVLKRGDKLLGVMGLHNIDYVSGLATTGTMLGAKEEWGKGYAQEAKAMLLEYAFNTLNLRKICSAAFSENMGSIKHNQKCGYKIEGVRKSQFYRHGRYHDEILLAIFKEDWQKVRSKQKTRR